jgi:hypothetical protein
MKRIRFIFTALLFSAIACVPPSQFKEVQMENQDCQDERDLLISANEKCIIPN